MKYLIVRKDTLEVVGTYEASQPDLGRVVASFEMVHVPVPENLDPKHAGISRNGNSFSAYDARTYRSTTSDRIEFGEKIIKDFLDQNEAAGVSEEMSYVLVQAFLPIIMCLKIGTLGTALHAIKNIPVEARDGVLISDAKLLHFANEIESFLGLPLSTSV